MLITNSPFWTLHCADCDGVVVSGVKIWCNLLVPNNDGVDFTSCSNVLMSDGRGAPNNARAVPIAVYNGKGFKSDAARKSISMKNVRE